MHDMQMASSFCCGGSSGGRPENQAGLTFNLEKEIDMKTMIDTVKTSVQAFVNDEDGTAMIEYGLMAALVSLAAIPALAAAGKSISDLITKISTEIAAALASGDPATV